MRLRSAARVRNVSIEVEGAGRIASAGLLHLADLLTDVDERRARRASYEWLATGCLDERGRPLNEVYTPEDAGAALEPVDGERIRRFLVRREADKPSSPHDRAQRMRVMTEALGSGRVRWTVPHNDPA